MTKTSIAMRHARGFSLVELATVMFIVALLIGGMLIPLSAQQDIRGRSDTERLLNEAREALIGYAIINGRLPCPASTTSNGRSSPEGSGVCTNPYDGFLPAATLGLVSAANDGYAYDGWTNETAHRLRYALSAANGSAFSTTGQMQAVGLGLLAGDLVVCRSGTGITATACQSGTPGANSLTENAVAVVFSQGKNASTGGTSTDEAPNLDGNSVFVSAIQSGDYDDSLIWLSPNVLLGRLVAAGAWY